MQNTNSLSNRVDDVKHTLVTTHISQQSPSWVNFKLELFPCSLRVLRPGSSVISKRGKRGVISAFSWASKRRLRFTAVNADPALISQFGMTYHNRIPSGREVKGDLNRFLVGLKRAYPGIGYLWILEFQKRGSVHLHLWLTLPVGFGLRQYLAGRWNEIAELDDDEHLKVHMHSKNFIAWEMRGGGYLCKYLDKEHQKRVPDDFYGVGRFWGCSRGLVKQGVIVGDQDLDERFSYVSWRPSKFILRTVCKSQERKIHKKTRWCNWGRRSHQNYTLLEGRSIYDVLIDYHKKQSPF